jgi:hypothetical protein
MDEPDGISDGEAKGGINELLRSQSRLENRSQNRGWHSVTTNSSSNGTPRKGNHHVAIGSSVSSDMP